MILKNLKIYSDGSLRKGAILINDGTINSIIYNPTGEHLKNLIEQNKDGELKDCMNRILVPGIIDIHSHLRDMDQCEKETFLTGTKAAAFSGITTVFNMPNTKPPAITGDQVASWMNKAKNNIHVNVGFIAGVPKGLNYEEIVKIVELGVIGFKIYPLGPLNDIDWKDPLNIQTLLDISSKFQVPIFIHPDWSLSQDRKDEIHDNHVVENHSALELHNKLYPREKEASYVKFILENYFKILSDKNLNSKDYPIVHFCHISCKESYSLIKKVLTTDDNLKISFEVTPHHLLLSNKVNLKNANFGKVLPPLRDELHSRYLFNELKKGNIELIGTDHAPHTLQEKSRDYSEAPSGFPGFETYPLLLLNKTCQGELSLEKFVQAASENPAIIFNLKKKGFVKVGYDADLIILERAPEYLIKPEFFKTKAKYTPFENFKTSIKIWKVFLKGEEINIDDSEPKGKIITSY